MFTHIMVGANDRTVMLEFYDAVLAPLGLVRDRELAEDHPAGTLWKRPGRRWPQFAVARPFDGLEATPGNGVQISFAAPSRDAVREAWRRALHNGGTDEGAPGIRPQYNDDFFAAYCRDPGGNKLCFLHAEDIP